MVDSLHCDPTERYPWTVPGLKNIQKQLKHQKCVFLLSPSGMPETHSILGVIGSLEAKWAWLGFRVVKAGGSKNLEGSTYSTGRLWNQRKSFSAVFGAGSATNSRHKSTGHESHSYEQKSPREGESRELSPPHPASKLLLRRRFPDRMRT